MGIDSWSQVQGFKLRLFQQLYRGKINIKCYYSFNTAYNWTSNMHNFSALIWLSPACSVSLVVWELNHDPKFKGSNTGFAGNGGQKASSESCFKLEIASYFQIGLVYLQVWMILKRNYNLSILGNKNTWKFFLIMIDWQSRSQWIDYQ